MGKEDLRRYMENSVELCVSEAAKVADVSLYTVYAFIKEEGLQRVAKGTYAAADAWLDEMLLLARRNHVAVFSNESAPFAPSD